ncbi:unnamed protein product, partial [Acidithrix sp. C25]
VQTVITLMIVAVVIVGILLYLGPMKARRGGTISKGASNPQLKKGATAPKGPSTTKNRQDVKTSSKTPSKPASKTPPSTPSKSSPKPPAKATEVRVNPDLATTDLKGSRTERPEAPSKDTPPKPHATPSLGDALGRSRETFGGRIAGLFRRGSLDDSFWDDLQDALILSDVGFETTTKILEGAQAKAKVSKAKSPTEAVEIVRSSMLEILSKADRALKVDGDKPIVWLFVGVNGVGKTTTIGKVAAMLGDRKLLLAAADTFRAAAADQLSLWGERANVQVISGAPGADPSSVLFDAIASAKARDFDIVLGDTAGRLQNKTNLIEELKKIYRTVEKAQGNLGEVLLVLDATTGQNGLSQAKVFSEAVGVTGVVLTKLDGSAKGGIAFAIEDIFQIPVKLVGVGESISDLIPFDPEAYVASLIERS